MPFILGKKIEMTQIWKDNKVMPVTLIQAGSCIVTQIKNKEKDGYDAVQFGFDKKLSFTPAGVRKGKAKYIKKTEKGKEYRYLREFRGFKFPVSDFKVGDEIDASVFQEGDIVKVSGISKGKGFQGAVKRWGFHGRNATHGVKHEHRTVGSVGSTEAARVFPGKKMPGRMGADRVTLRNLTVAKVDKENNIIAIKGAIPGRRGTLIEIKK